MSLKNTPTKELSLSPRQRQCLQMLADGHTAAAIAFQLGISVRMVRVHLCKARVKLGAVSSTQAVHLALRLGLLD
jgi:DNA-binding CsgD family transcriptional regulator